MTDPIADMLTRIRNAFMAQKKETQVPYSKLKQNLAEKLVELGYLSATKTTGEGKDKVITITLKYKDKLSVISAIKRISKPGRRVYHSTNELKPILSGHGSAILTTNRGILSDKQARELGVGGEVICHIW